MNEQLLPCPFCGGGAKLHSHAWDGGKILWWVACTICAVDTHTGDDSSEAAIAAWNQRVPVEPTTINDDWMFAHAPEPEPLPPDPPEGWEDFDDDDVPHYDTPGGY